MLIAVPMCLMMFYMANYYVLKDEHKKLQQRYSDLLNLKDKNDK